MFPFYIMQSGSPSQLLELVSAAETSLVLTWASEVKPVCIEFRTPDQEWSSCRRVAIGSSEALNKVTLEQLDPNCTYAIRWVGADGKSSEEVYMDTRPTNCGPSPSRSCIIL